MRSGRGDPDDERLMRRFRDGDSSAYELLVHRHLGFVHRHARRYLGDSAGAEDVAQEVFLRLHRSAALFREPTNFMGWLATMTTRLALNELRTRSRKRWVPRSALEGENAGEEWRPGNGATLSEGVDLSIEEERAEVVRRGLAELPERQQLATWLQRFEGWTLEDIGETLELTVPAVKSLLHRARCALNVILKPYFEDEYTASARTPANAVTPDAQTPTKGEAGR